MSSKISLQFLDIMDNKQDLTSTPLVDTLNNDHLYDGLSDEELKEIFDDMEADRIIEEYKSGLIE